MSLLGLLTGTEVLLRADSYFAYFLSMPRHRQKKLDSAIFN